MSLAGVEIYPLKVIADERGAVLHMLRSDHPAFQRFGEVYFSYINPGVIKAWKCHQKQTQHFAVPVGEIELVLIDERSESLTFGRKQSLRLGLNNYQLVKIPPGIVYGFKCLSGQAAMVANFTDIPHEREESRTYPISEKSAHNWLNQVELSAL